MLANSAAKKSLNLPYIFYQFNCINLQKIEEGRGNPSDPVPDPKHKVGIFFRDSDEKKEKIWPLLCIILVSLW